MHKHIPQTAAMLYITLCTSPSFFLSKCTAVNICAQTFSRTFLQIWRWYCSGAFYHKIGCNLELCQVQSVELKNYHLETLLWFYKTAL